MAGQVGSIKTMVLGVSLFRRDYCHLRRNLGHGEDKMGPTSLAVVRIGGRTAVVVSGLAGEPVV